MQKETEALSRELKPSEIVNLFEEAFHLKSNPRFNLVDYNITTDRSQSPAPPEPGKALNTKNLKRRFTGIIEIDNVQHAITGVGPGAISSLAAALATLGIDLDVVDYKEHSIGLGREVKAVTYIQCTAAGSKEQVWGVGIHQDVVQASLIALLSAASSVSLTWFKREQYTTSTINSRAADAHPSSSLPALDLPLPSVLFAPTPSPTRISRPLSS